MRSAEEIPRLKTLLLFMSELLLELFKVDNYGLIHSASSSTTYVSWFAVLPLIPDQPETRASASSLKFETIKSDWCGVSPNGRLRRSINAVRMP